MGGNTSRLARSIHGLIHVLLSSDQRHGIVCILTGLSKLNNLSLISRASHSDSLGSQEALQWEHVCCQVVSMEVVSIKLGGNDE